MNNNLKTIVALSTPYMKSAIHIIRVSGANTYQILEKLTKKPIEKKGYVFQRANLFDHNNNLIDDVILIKYVFPKSYTGEDLIEINCHGSTYIVDLILKNLIIAGAVLAERGEFTKRAYLNNKIDLNQSEAINNLISSTNQIALNAAISGLNPNMLTTLHVIRDNVFKILGQIEVDIDYPEYEKTPDVSYEQMLNLFDQSIKQLEEIINHSNKVLSIKDFINVGIIGKPNAGKSSLLNAFLKEDKAIVSSIAGTTRDLVESRVNLGDFTLNFIDTAGIRKATNQIEKIGIKKTNEIIKKANLIIYVIDASKKDDPEEIKMLKKINKDKLIIALNKVDKKVLSTLKGVMISAKTWSIDPLVDEIKSWLKNQLDFDLQSTLIMQSQNSLSILENVLINLKESQKIFLNESSTEVATFSLNCALDELNKLVNKSASLSFVDELFAKFCVGK